MLLTTSHLAALDHIGEREVDARYMRPTSESDAATFQALERAGLTERVRGEEYRLTADGRVAQRLVGGMEAAGVLPARRLLAPDWHFLDDDVLVAMEQAGSAGDRVASAAAAPLLARGLADLYDEPDELRATIALTGYGRAWRDLASRLRSAQGEGGVRGGRGAVHDESARGARPEHALA